MCHKLCHYSQDFLAPSPQEDYDMHGTCTISLLNLHFHPFEFRSKALPCDMLEPINE